MEDKLVIVGCENLEGKVLTTSKTSYFIGEREVPFYSCIIKNGYMFYLKHIREILNDMGFKGVVKVFANTVICNGYDNTNRNIKDVGLVSIDGKVLIKITLKSEFPFYEGFSRLKN